MDLRQEWGKYRGLTTSTSVYQGWFDYHHCWVFYLQTDQPSALDTPISQNKQSGTWCWLLWIPSCERSELGLISINAHFWSIGICIPCLPSFWQHYHPQVLLSALFIWIYILYNNAFDQKAHLPQKKWGGVLIVVQRKGIWLESVKVWVWFPTLLSGLGSQHCCGCGIGWQL